MKVKSEREVTQSYPTLSDPMDYSLPGSSWGFPGRSTGVGCHCLLRARILEWVISFSKACMHAKSLQSCLTLCDPTDSSPQDSLGKNTGVGCHFLLHPYTLHFQKVRSKNILKLKKRMRMS